MLHNVGVGALFNPSMSGFVERSLSCLDYLAVIPDRGWIDHGPGASRRFEMLPIAETFLGAVAGECPIVLHGIGLSICTAGRFDEEYARRLMTLADQLDCPWFSEHLSFTRVGTGHEREVNSALPLPVPYDRDVLDLLSARVSFLTRRRRFLLENNAYYVCYPDQDLTEAQFFNQLCERTGCGVLLDLHNLYTNAVNHGFAASDYLDHLDLATVGEIHVAGGVEMMGYHTDSHTGPVLEPVWRLLQDVVPRATSLRGVTFEFHESSYSSLGESGILEQIDRARAIVSGARRVA